MPNNLDKNTKLAFGLFFTTLLTVALYNLAQEKDTDRFVPLIETADRLNVDDDPSTPQNEEIGVKMERFEQSISTVREVKTDDIPRIESLVFDQTALLSDVTGGGTILGLNTGGEAAGTVRAVLSDNNYYLYADFQSLPDAPPKTYYEGWVARAEPFRFESTGRVEKVDGVYKNFFISEKDLLDHRFYVLTLEPEDGDPDPSEHILEGSLK